MKHITSEGMAILFIAAIALILFPITLQAHSVSGISELNYLEHVSLEEDPVPYITLSYDEWQADPLIVMITTAPETQQQSGKYISITKSAIERWSDLLKSYSGSYNAWNIQVMTAPGISNFPSQEVYPDIIVELAGDPEGQECNDYSGLLGYAEEFPYNLNEPVYSRILTSCVINNQYIEMPFDVVYSTVLHEFGHILGLGHASYIDGDLMCSEEVTDPPDNSQMCHTDPFVKAEPSRLDVYALLYKYGKDGFLPPNTDLGQNPYYSMASVP